MLALSKEEYGEVQVVRSDLEEVEVEGILQCCVV